MSLDLSRRSFVKRLLGAAAIAVVDPSELLEQLAPRRLIVAGFDMPRPTHGSFVFTQENRTFRVEELAAGYRRSTAKLYRTYSRHVPEYNWIRDLETADRIERGFTADYPRGFAVEYPVTSLLE